MSKHQVRAVFEQFHWLSKEFPGLKKKNHATVSRADINTLEISAGDTGNGPEFGDFDGFVRIFLCDQDGACNATVHRKGWYGHVRDWFSPKKVIEVLKALDADWEVERIRYILVVTTYQFDMILAPKNSSMKDLLREREAMEEASYRKEQEKAARASNS
ncbi:MAG: hypothetical protein WAV50_01765 [Minisyncoccia bacterium]